MTGPGCELARCPAGAGAARIGDKENMLTDLPINLKTLIEAIDATFFLADVLHGTRVGRGWPCVCGIRR